MTKHEIATVAVLVFASTFLGVHWLLAVVCFIGFACAIEAMRRYRDQ